MRETCELCGESQHNGKPYYSALRQCWRDKDGFRPRSTAVADPDARKKDANVVSHLQQIARGVDEQLPEAWGFILMAFPFGQPDGRLNYVAKCGREDAIKIVHGWLAKNQNPADFARNT